MNSEVCALSLCGLLLHFSLHIVPVLFINIHMHVFTISHMYAHTHADLQGGTLFQNSTLFKRDLQTHQGMDMHPMRGWEATASGFSYALHYDFSSATKPPPITKVYAFGGLTKGDQFYNKFLDSLMVLDLTNLAAGFTNVTLTTRPGGRTLGVMMRINEDTLVLYGGIGVYELVYCHVCIIHTYERELLPEFKRTCSDSASMDIPIPLFKIR
jgi:hypothetical protein